MHKLHTDAQISLLQSHANMHVCAVTNLELSHFTVLLYHVKYNDINNFSICLEDERRQCKCRQFLMSEPVSHMLCLSGWKTLIECGHCGQCGQCGQTRLITG